MNNEKILITGSLGNVGHQVVKRLKDTNADFIASDLFEDRITRVLGDDVKSVKLDFTDKNTYDKALEGIDKMFLLRPPAISNVKKHIEPFIKRAKEKGVKHIVFLSLQGVENNKITPHYKIEKAILKHNIDYTFVRPSFYMQNLSTTHKEDILKSDIICVPAGYGKTSFIDVRDIAEVIVKTLTEDQHINKAYEITGKNYLTYYEIADIFSKVLGRNIEYTNPSVIKFFFHMRKQKVKPMFIIIMIALYSITRLHKTPPPTMGVEHILGKEPISFTQFVEDYKSVWKSN